jgi:hypothetical protein
MSRRMLALGQNLRACSDVSRQNTERGGSPMTPPRMTRKLRTVAPVLALGLMLLAVSAASASSHAATLSDSKQIASATLNQDIRIILRAVKGSGGSATVYVFLSEFSGGAWNSLGRQPVGDPNGWLWPVVTDVGAICRFSTSNVDPYPIEVRLLISTSIGCSPATYNFHVDKYDQLSPG